MQAAMTWAGAAVLVLALGAAPSMAETGEKDKISDQAAQWYLDKVFKSLGPQFSERDGTVVRIDRSKPDEVMVPMATAKTVIAVAWRGARARICDMPDEFVANFEALKITQNAKQAWTPQQRHFMKTLYNLVVQLNSGKAKVIVKDGETVVEEQEVASKVIKPCSDEERASLTKEVAAFVKEAEAAVAAKGGGATGSTAAPGAAAEAAPAADKK